MNPYNNPGSEPGETEDPFNKISMAFVREGEKIEWSSVDVPPDAYSKEPFEKDKPRDTWQEQPPEKLHPLLQQWILDRPGDEIELIMINFRDDLQLPRFPEPAADMSPDSPAHQNALRRAEELIRQIKARRADNYERLTRELGERYKAQVLETFWLINAVLVEIPLGILSELAQREDVLYLEPRYSGEEPSDDSDSEDPPDDSDSEDPPDDSDSEDPPDDSDPEDPPGDSDPDNDLEDGRAALASDPLYNLGLTAGRIGLLDTGVYPAHTVFSSPSTIGSLCDCVNGDPDCNPAPGYNPKDDCWDHGTSSAAIITANANEGPAFRGVTAIMLDSFKVYPSSFANGKCNGTLDVAAAVRGFQAAVKALDKVIVAEMQSSGSYFSSISKAADDAFDTGAVVVAANGNEPDGPVEGQVKAPANAHRVIGVGDFDVKTGAPIPSQCFGPTTDRRVKPDIQTPTNTETASNASDKALRVFRGTSGATPYAAGAAALLRNWLQGSSPSIDPGQVYAQLILFGQKVPFDNISGAGPLRLSIVGGFWRGKESVANGATINLTLNISEPAPNTLDAALWWPEAALPSIHHDIDLFLIDPNGVVRAESRSGTSVFERARVTGSVTPGAWTLRIRGYDVPGGAQTVYWAAHVFLA